MTVSSGFPGEVKGEKTFDLDRFSRLQLLVGPETQRTSASVRVRDERPARFQTVRVEGDRGQRSSVWNFVHQRPIKRRSHLLVQRGVCIRNGEGKSCEEVSIVVCDTVPWLPVSSALQRSCFHKKRSTYQQKMPP